jgi:hypothetical protein
MSVTAILVVNFRRALPIIILCVFNVSSSDLYVKLIIMLYIMLDIICCLRYVLIYSYMTFWLLALFLY